MTPKSEEFIRTFIRDHVSQVTLPVGFMRLILYEEDRMWGRTVYEQEMMELWLKSV